VSPEFYNQMLTLHALIMVFGAIMPAFVGFANWMIPMMIGAPDMAFARMNNWSFWLLPPAAILLVRFDLRPRGRCRNRLDPVPAAVHPDGDGHGHGHFRGAHPRHVVDHGVDQHRHHHSQPAHAGHDPDEDAAVLLDVAGDRLLADRRRCRFWPAR
jgi:hypothetical protein